MLYMEKREGARQAKVMHNPCSSLVIFVVDYSKSSHHMLQYIIIYVYTTRLRHNFLSESCVRRYDSKHVADFHPEG
jgi:hypothetical protein